MVGASDPPQRPHSAGILALTAGELGTRGSPELRDKEAEQSARALGLGFRETLDLPDGGIVNSPENRARLAVVIRRVKPAIVITHWLKGRHPDHPVAAQLVRDACFAAGLRNVEPGTAPHRPRKILHAMAYRQDFIRPTFVVDVSDDFERKIEAIRCYASQFEGETQAGEIYPNGEPLVDVVRHYGAYYGTLIRRPYGEPYFTTEVMLVEDVVSLEVATF